MPRKKLIPDEETVTVSVRLPDSLKERIETRAINNRRSVNQEINFLLLIALDLLEKEQAPGAGELPSQD